MWSPLAVLLVLLLISWIATSFSLILCFVIPSLRRAFLFKIEDWGAWSFRSTVGDKVPKLAVVVGELSKSERSPGGRSLRNSWAQTAKASFQSPGRSSRLGTSWVLATKVSWHSGVRLQRVLSLCGAVCAQSKWRAVLMSSSFEGIFASIRLSNWSWDGILEHDVSNTKALVSSVNCSTSRSRSKVSKRLILREHARRRTARRAWESTLEGIACRRRQYWTSPKCSEVSLGSQYSCMVPSRKTFRKNADSATKTPLGIWKHPGLSCPSPTRITSCSSSGLLWS